MTRTLTPDICVIGAGSGGLSVAAAAVAFGLDVVLVERGRMGGDCLNYGCVPSKALIAAARHAQSMREGTPLGIGAVEPEIDFEAVYRHVHEAIAAIAPNDSAERFNALGVQVIRAEGRFRDPQTLVADDTEISARYFVLATGSSPFVPQIPGLDKADYLTNETIFDLKTRPEHLIIIGGGAIGMELAQAYRRLGSKVTVIEIATALGKEDPELAAIVLKQVRDEGVVIHERTEITRVVQHGLGSVQLSLKSADGSETVDGTHLLVAAGRVPNLRGMGLDKAGVVHGEWGLQVDNRLRTSNRRIYAVGDATGLQQYTHAANYHAGLVVRSILFKLPVRERRNIVPRVTFTEPELAHIGLTEAEATKAYRSIRVLRWPYAENDRARTEHRTHGHIKVIASPRGRILGVSIVGAQAGELIGVWALALSKNLTLRDMASYVAPYPTLGEIGKRAAVAYFTPMARKPLVRRLVNLLRKFD
jgi:pyruvate/2-oxoglutarate dehydrogenase complex dihydrolipoamide dehydrogenase (E3) component